MPSDTDLLTLTEDQSRHARRRAMHFSRRTAPESDLLAELDERLNLLARYQADLDAGDVHDGDAGQLQGGIEYERVHVEAIVAELEARERAHPYGYRPSGTPVESDLSARFAAAKAIDTAALIRELTNQAGLQAGNGVKFLCPFHADGHERTPSLVVYPDGHFHCFACRVHGADAAAFVAAFKTIGLVEALRLLETSTLGIQVPA